jgi:hypothetical protein
LIEPITEGNAVTEIKYYINIGNLLQLILSSE